MFTLYKMSLIIQLFFGKFPKTLVSLKIGIIKWRGERVLNMLREFEYIIGPLLKKKRKINEKM